MFWKLFNIYIYSQPTRSVTQRNVYRGDELMIHRQQKLNCLSFSIVTFLIEWFQLSRTVPASIIYNEHRYTFMYITFVKLSANIISLLRFCLLTSTSFEIKCILFKWFTPKNQILYYNLQSRATVHTVIFKVSIM